MFTQHTDNGYSQPLPGIQQKTLAFGDKTLMVEFVLVKGSVLPLHAHPHEQTGYLVKGHMRITIGGEEFDTRPGDSWTVPSNVRHGARILEDSVAVEVFSPTRKEYLPKETRD